MIEALFGLIPTSLKNSIWTDAKAGFLDVAVSSTGDRPATSLAGFAGSNSDIGASAPGTQTSLPIMLADTYYTVLDLTDSGWLKFFHAYRSGAGVTSTTLTTRITIDGVVVATFTESSGSSMDGRGYSPVGYFGSYGFAMDRVRFGTSLKVEVKSSGAQDAGGDIRAKYIYQLD